MLKKVLWQTLLVTPCIFGVTLVASVSPGLAEIDQTTEPALTLAAEAPPSFDSQVVEGSSAHPVPSDPLVSTIASSVVPEISAAAVFSQSNTSELHIGQLEQPLTTQSAEIVPSSPNFPSPIIPSEQQPIPTLQTWVTDGKLTPLQTSNLQVSQTTVTPAAISQLNPESSSPSAQGTPVETPSTDTQETPAEAPSTDTQETPVETQPPTTEELQTAESQSTRWHILFKPYVYIPITIYGDTTFEGPRGNEASGDFAVDFDQIESAIQNRLNFAFLGEVQAWAPDYHWGALVNVNYISTSSDATFTRPVRLEGAANFIPTELDADVDTQVWSVDLAAAYRFYDQSKVNPEGVSTEFDLGPLVFDVIGGLNISGIDTNLDLSTNLGGEASFDGGSTVVSPLLGARFRVNFSQKLALVTEGSVSGFGISGLTRWSAQTGLDWIFSGDTSLGLGYRFAYLSYDGDDDFGVNLNQNGPYLSFSFRF